MNESDIPPGPKSGDLGGLASPRTRDQIQKPSYEHECRAAFNRIFRRFEPKARGFLATKYSGLRKEEREDAQQAFFLKIWNFRDREGQAWDPGRAGLHSYLYFHLNFSALDMLRRRKVTQSLDDVDEPGTEPDYSMVDREDLVKLTTSILTEMVNQGACQQRKMDVCLDLLRVPVLTEDEVADKHAISLRHVQTIRSEIEWELPEVNRLLENGGSVADAVREAHKAYQDAKKSRTQQNKAKKS